MLAIRWVQSQEIPKLDKGAIRVKSKNTFIELSDSQNSHDACRSKTDPLSPKGNLLDDVFCHRHIPEAVLGTLTWQSWLAPASVQDPAVSNFEYILGTDSTVCSSKEDVLATSSEDEGGCEALAQLDLDGHEICVNPFLDNSGCWGSLLARRAPPPPTADENDIFVKSENTFLELSDYPPPPLYLDSDGDGISACSFKNMGGCEAPAQLDFDGHEICEGNTFLDKYVRTTSSSTPSSVRPMNTFLDNCCAPPPTAHPDLSRLSERPRSPPPPPAQEAKINKWRWEVGAQTLKGRDNRTVSGPCELPLGPSALIATFRMIIDTKEDENRKKLSFEKAGGKGSVWVKCETELPNALAQVTVSITIGEGALAQTLGPISHNFFESGLCGLPGDRRELNFLAAVDPKSRKCLVTLEIFQAFQ